MSETINLTQALEALAKGERVTADEMPEGTHWKTKERGTAALWSSGGSVLLYPEHASWHFRVVSKREPKSRIREMASKASSRRGGLNIGADMEAFAREVVEAVVKFTLDSWAIGPFPPIWAEAIRREFLEPREAKR